MQHKLQVWVKTAICSKGENTGTLNQKAASVKLEKGFTANKIKH